MSNNMFDDIADAGTTSTTQAGVASSNKKPAAMTEEQQAKLKARREQAKEAKASMKEEKANAVFKQNQAKAFEMAKALEAGRAHFERARFTAYAMAAGIDDMEKAVSDYMVSPEAIAAVSSKKEAALAKGKTPNVESFYRSVMMTFISSLVAKGVKAATGPVRETLMLRTNELTSAAGSIVTGNADNIPVTLFVRNPDGVSPPSRVTVNVPSINAAKKLEVILSRSAGKGNYANEPWYISLHNAKTALNKEVDHLQIKPNAEGEPSSPLILWKALNRPMSKAAVSADLGEIPVWMRPRKVTAFKVMSMTNLELAEGLKAGTKWAGLSSMVLMRTPEQLAAYFAEADANGVDLPSTIIVQPSSQRSAAWNDKDRLSYNTALLEMRGETVASAPIILHVYFTVEWNGKVYTIAALTDGQQRATTVTGTLSNVFALTTGISRPNVDGDTKTVKVYWGSSHPAMEEIKGLYANYSQTVHQYEPVEDVRLSEDELMALAATGHEAHEAVVDKIKTAISVGENQVDRRFTATNATGKRLTPEEITRAEMPLGLLMETVPLMERRSVVSMLAELGLAGKVHSNLTKMLFAGQANNTLAHVSRGKDVAFIARITAMLHYLDGQASVGGVEPTSFPEIVSGFDSLTQDQIAQRIHEMELGFDLMAKNDAWIKIVNNNATQVDDLKVNQVLAAALVAWFGRYLAKCNYTDATTFLQDIGDVQGGEADDQKIQTGINFITDLLETVKGIVPADEKDIGFRKAITSADSVARVNALFAMLDGHVRPTLDDKAGVA